METGIKDNEKCAPLTVIFARGSGEDANMGSVVGPPLAASLRHILDNRVAVQGVDYHASMTVSNSIFLFLCRKASFS